MKHDIEIPGAETHQVDDQEYLKPIFNVCSIDWGFSSDFTAVTVGTLYKRVIVPVFGERRYDGYEIVVRYQDRWRELPYPESIARVLKIIENIPQLEKPTQLYVIMDVAGCGLPVYQEIKKTLRKSATYVKGYMTTSGEQTHESDGIYYVPKKDLVGSLIYAAETKMLKLAGDLKTRDALADEWLKFTRKRRESGTESFEAAGSGHDDLISSLGFLCNFCIQRKDGGMVPISLKPLHIDPPKKSDSIPSKELVRFELKGFENLRSLNG